MRPDRPFLAATAYQLVTFIQVRFPGPFGVGLVLDYCGSDAVLGWGLGFGYLAAITLTGLVILRRLGRAG